MVGHDQLEGGEGLPLDTELEVVDLVAAGVALVLLAAVVDLVAREGEVDRLAALDLVGGGDEAALQAAGLDAVGGRVELRAAAPVVLGEEAEGLGREVELRQTRSSR
jgi:hypothetical protein